MFEATNNYLQDCNSLNISSSTSGAFNHTPNTHRHQDPQWAALKVLLINMIMNLASVYRPLPPGNEFVPKVTAIIAH